MTLFSWFIFALLLLYLWHTLKPRRRKSDWWANYRRYLRSPEWQRKRQEKFAQIGGRFCQRCGQTRGCIQVHHLPGSYGRLGRENPAFDLVALCYSCHRAEHPGKEF